ncbi:MAG: hypothetical protein IKS36_05545 [Bacteroidales bacterium]|nr:hypothetical protein [Bacteroidales bacterium]
MKKIVFFVGLLLLNISLLKAQDYIVPEETWYHTEVLGSNYHGYVFNKEWGVDIMVENQDGRFTPEDIDIAKAEKLMQKKLAFLNRNHENQEGMCPIIDEHIRKYTRQYVGFTDINGAKIIWINAVWDENAESKLSKDIVRATGGCGRYWSIKVNLDTENVYGLEVNESGDIKYIPRVKKPGPRISKPKNERKIIRIRKTGIMHNPAEVTF